jgi:hypothetical protein
MQLINLTPHAIVLRSAGGADYAIAPSGDVARVATIAGEPVVVEGIPVPVAPAVTFGAVEGLPEPKPGVAYIVSGIVGAACAGRSDVFVPGTGPTDGAIRHPKGHPEEGRIIAVTRLNRV